MKDNFVKSTIEFIGTFFFVLTVGYTLVMSGDSLIPALAIGLMFIAMIYAGGYVSKGFYNPAISLAMVIRGDVPVERLLQYWTVQIAAGIFASIIVLLSAHPGHFVTCPYSLARLVFGEFLFTFALCYVVLHLITVKDADRNPAFGFVIGSILIVGILIAGGSLCFGAFNPVVALCLGLLGVACWNCVSITIATNIFAAILAGLLFRFIFAKSVINSEEVTAIEKTKERV